MPSRHVLPRPARRSSSKPPALKTEHPDCFVQSHISENRREVEWIRELFPAREDYLDVYDHYGLIGRRTIYDHGIWLSERELHRCHDTGTALAHARRRT